MVVREINAGNDKVAVRCASGELLEADDVVLTAPPSTWHNIRFSPRLPHALRPQMGIAVKYLASVKNRFWEKGGLAPDALTDEMISMTWDGTDNQGSDAHGAALVAFSGGPAAERCRQRWLRARDAAYVEALDKIYPHFRENFVRGRFMNWPAEMWTRRRLLIPCAGRSDPGRSPAPRRPLGDCISPGNIPVTNLSATWRAPSTPALPWRSGFFFRAVQPAPVHAGAVTVPA
jgi:monoamine oxidase